MTLSSDELEILEYLKSWKGNSISMVEICRCAGGRRKFRESPHWARPLMARLVESHLIEVNDRGHYRFNVPETAQPVENVAPVNENENYFPTPKQQSQGVVGDNYFSSSTQAETESDERLSRWISPQMGDILRKSGKKFGHRG